MAMLLLDAECLTGLPRRGLCEKPQLNQHLTLEEPVYSLLMEKGYSDEFGARLMERTIEQLIAQSLAGLVSRFTRPVDWLGGSLL